MKLYPMIFEPILVPKVWGGQRLRQWGKNVSRHTTVGESWEISDLRSDDGKPSKVASILSNGPLAGMTLRELMDKFGDQIIPKELRSPTGSFPLLIKYLDAVDNLSVQTHPSPAYAKLHPEASLKDELWYVLETNPWSKIYNGVKADVWQKDLEQFAGRREILELMYTDGAIKGDLISIPSGTLHALGSGIVVAEIQSVSDTTFRLYDWGRGRNLQIEEGLKALDTKLDIGISTKKLENKSFMVEKVSLTYNTRLVCSGCCIVMFTGGDGFVYSIDGSFEEVRCPMGTTVLIPEEISNRAMIGVVGATTILYIQPTA